MEKQKKFIIIAVIVVIIIVLIIAFFLRKPKVEEPVIAEEIYGLSGEIKEISSNTLLVEANILLADLSQEPIKKTIKVIVNNETDILSLKFPEQIPKGNDDPVFPEEKEIRFSDLSIGDKIDMLMTGNISENIKNKTEVIAKSINVVE